MKIGIIGYNIFTSKAASHPLPVLISNELAGMHIALNDRRVTTPDMISSRMEVMPLSVGLRKRKRQTDKDAAR